MNLQSVGGLLLRHLFLYTRNWIRPIELVFWPLMDLLVIGYLMVFLQQKTAGDFPQFLRFLLGAVIFWDVLFRSQQAVAISFLEDVWTRNLLNIFAAPIRISEYLTATFALGLIRITLTVVLLATVARLLYAFNLLEFKWSLLPFLVNLLLFGWSLGMVSTALIIRWGQAAESLAWAIPFLVQPLAAVFYPLEVLPRWMQWLAASLPCTYVFEGMRAVLASDQLAQRQMVLATALNALWLAGTAWFFLFMFKQARTKGLLTKVATQ